jgi:ppGpp synthetase/RelA/SpoT-type nucleotidyltranferase
VLTHLKDLLVERKLAEVLKIEPQPRTKDPVSFVDKAFHRNKGYEDPYENVEDKVGVRFVVLLTSDIGLIEQAIKLCDFEVSKDKDFEADRASRPLEFAYQSDHFVVRPKADVVDGDRTYRAGMPCEIQVRTLLQHAHSELTHDRDYKGEKAAPARVKRNIARSMALIEAADDFFQQVVKDLEDLDRPTRELFQELEKVYRGNVSSDPERARSNILIIEALAETLGSQIAVDTTTLLVEKPFVRERILDRMATQHLFRQPAVLLAYLGADKAPTGTKGRWPLTPEELRPIYSDLGKAFDEF